MTGRRPPRVLVVAGSDSGGGAGIQADIKTVTMLGGFAATAVTAITAQNTLGVTDVMPVPTGMVLAQLEAVVSDIGVDAVKIGMIGSAETTRALADRLDPRRPGHERAPAMPVVFDPVMVASSGAALADGDTVEAFEMLMSRAALVTPNIPELTFLTGCEIGDVESLFRAAAKLAKRVGTAVLAKGGHLPGDEVTDVLIEDGRAIGSSWFSGRRIETRHTHGTGCTLASAIATHLGRGLPLEKAVERGRDFVRRAMLAAPEFGAGHGPMGHAEAGTDEMNLNQVTLPATDYAASVEFYRTLGLTQIVDSPGRYARFECPGGATLSIHVEVGKGPGDAAICFESAELDAWVERLISAGVEFDELPEDRRWLWREAWLRDPAGNRLILYRAGENRRFPPWRLAG
ncbi:MAG: hydroxymethylpyrimidine/phosphomethylpyrimidine kinase [Sphingomonadales bacterium]|jgi:hydroxymethylpyrimidine/phosphomethylpyrimidine kinase|nr:hydroxymethylpyrimidine/phosphomethylpyrimidine kinase [Sphingomonadales bacterium]